MERLEKLSVSDLVALYEWCPEKDEAKIAAEIERKSGVNISDTDKEPLGEKIGGYLVVFVLALILIIWTIAAIKVIHTL